MLILVAVTVQIVINSNLFGTAQDAGDRTKTAYEEEGKMGEVTINGKTYESMEDYIAGVEKIVEVHNWQYTDNTMAAVKCVCDECKKVNAEGQTLYIGQEVAYGETIEEAKVEQNGVEVELCSNLQIATMAAPDPDWVIFGVEDKNKNGTNESILITTLEPSYEELELEGAEAYNSGIAEINGKCKEIYGEEARGMTIEDVNRTLGYTPTGGMYQDNSGFHVLDGFETKLNTLDIWDSIKAYNIEEKEGKYYTPDYPEGTTDETVLGNVKIDGYYYTAEDYGRGEPYVPETTSGVVKSLVFGENRNLVYWLASRGVYAFPDSARFGPGAVDYGYADSCDYTFNSNGLSYADSFAVRPVVSLISEIPELGEILITEVTES